MWLVLVDCDGGNGSSDLCSRFSKNFSVFGNIAAPIAVSFFEEQSICLITIGGQYFVSSGRL